MRRDARKIAFSLIYEYLFTNEKDDLSLEQFIKKEDADDTVFEITGSDKAFIVDIYNNVVNNLDVYRKKVAALAEGFKELVEMKDVSTDFSACFRIIKKLKM